MPVAGVGPHLSSSVKDAVGVSTSTAFFFCACSQWPMSDATELPAVSFPVDVTSATCPGIIARCDH